MNMKRKLAVAMSALAFMAFSFTSCSDELEGTEGITTNEVPTVKVAVNVSSNLGTNNSKTRAGIGMSENSDGKFQYNFDNLYVQQGDTGAFDLVIAAAYATDTSYQVFEDVPIRISGSNYYISVTTDALEVPASADNHLSELKVCGLLVPNGTGSKFNNAFNGRTQSEMDSLVTLGGDFFVPLYSCIDSSKVTVNGDNTVANSTLNISMNFYMIGTVITAKFKSNPLASAVYVDSVRLRYSNVKSGMITWRMGDDDSNGHPNFTFRGNEENNNYKLAFSSPLYVESDLFNTTSEAYKGRAWVMPVDSSDFTTDYDIYYHVKGDVDYTPLVVNYPQNGTTTTYSGGFQYGTVNTIAMKMPESDLMITEFEHLNPGSGRSNYSMIELYNPTAEPIDLRCYGLVRLTEFVGATDTTAAEVDNPYTSWKAYVDGSGTTSGTLSYARVQDIYVDLTGYSSYPESSSILQFVKPFGGPSNCKTVGGTTLTSGDFTNSFMLFDSEHYGDRAYPVKQTYEYLIGDSTYSIELEPWELGPGQTVILGAGAIEYQTYHNGDAYNYDCWHSGSNYFNSYYLDYAAQRGRLKFAVAVDNGGNHDNVPSYPKAGVMQHDMSSIMQLVKLDTINNTGEIIDMPGYLGDVPSRYVYYEWIQNNGGTITSDPFVFSRFASAMYPMYLNSRYYEDHRNRKDILDRRDDGSVTLNTSYRMYDWTWCFPSNFNITAPTSSTFSYSSAYYSPGTKSFEAAVYNNQ
jgi:hypothetical protein